MRIKYKLNQLGVLARGKSRHRPRNATALYGGIYPFFQTGDVKSAELYLYKYSQTYSEVGLAQSKLWEAGTLCITIAANVADTAILGISGCFPDSIIGFIADPKRSDARFIKYYIDTIKQQLISASKGTTQDNLSMDKLLTFDFEVPEVETQQRIAAILSAYDDLIENNAQRIAILEEMARRIYEEWFVNYRFPGHESRPLVESELGLIPEGWDILQLEDVCTRVTDGSHLSPKSVEHGLPMASVKDMHDWGINTNSCRKIDKDDYHKLVRNDCKPKLGDILIAKDGSYLKHTFVVDAEIDLVILSSIAILRPNGKFLANQFALYLQLPQIKSRMKGYVSGVAIPRIVLRDFRRFLILIPPAKMQKDWAEKCDPILSLCRMLVRKNENLRQARDLLIPRLISGELDVSTLPMPEDMAA